MLAAAVAFAAVPARAEDSITLPEIGVVATTPLLGSGIDRDKWPGAVETLGAPDIDETDGPKLTGALDRKVGSVSLNKEQGSPFQPDLLYRGFAASPIFGVAQGLAVYQNGVRLNESFGDTVNWDLIPDFAIDRVNLVGANPVFGLNALGGAIALGMKNGFTAPGTRFEIEGGSFGRVEGNAEYGINAGPFASYIGVGGVHEDGYRDHSPALLRKLYGDLGYRWNGIELHLSYARASNMIDAAGPTPVELLAQSRTAVFTLPQAMRNQSDLVTLGGSYAATGALRFDGNVYYRHFGQHLIDGNTTEVQACADPTLLCLGNASTLLVDAAGMPVANALGGATPSEIDRTKTETNAVGGSVQATLNQSLWNRGNQLVAGLALDHARTNYGAASELGILQPDRYVVGTGTIIDQPDGTLAPISLGASSDYYGLYATDTLDVTDALSVTVSGRYNLALIDLDDRFGTALGGHHSYGRFNPAAGGAYRLASWATAYLGYAEANRVPTAGELACANPAHPCALDAFLVSDPALKQVVARSWEAGLRGSVPGTDLPGRIGWHLGGFRTDSANDIINIASPLVTGLGYFQNAGTTRRQGVEAGLSYRAEEWSVSAEYALVDAIFLNDLTLSSPNNPAADANGNIAVRPGDRLPLVPEHRLKLAGDYEPAAGFKIGADLIVASGEFYAGDQSNQNPKIPGYHVVNLRASYRIGEHAEAFVHIDNVLDAHYATYGTFAPTGAVAPGLVLTDPRSLAVAEPLGVFVGVRASF